MCQCASRGMLSLNKIKSLNSPGENRYLVVLIQKEAITFS